ncbi:hypothetical protein BZA77DRAFT_340862 [Pyronema omphalodes]|nr:hypothetical protein BZA77DRAFT_340862 [Pyronema omphalodes]
MALVSRLRLGMLNFVPDAPTSFFSLLSPPLFHTNTHSFSHLSTYHPTSRRYVKPSTRDTEGTAPPMKFPAYGYLHPKIRMLTTAEEEHDAMLFGSLVEELSTILGAFKALPRSDSQVGVPADVDCLSNPPSPSSQLQHHRPVEFEKGLPSSSSSSSRSMERLTMEQHHQSDNEVFERALSFLDLSADVQTSSLPSSPKIRRSFEEDIPRLVEDLSLIERSILFAQEREYSSSTPKISSEPDIDRLSVPDVGQLDNEQSSTPSTKKFPPSLSSTRRASTNPSSNAESDQPFHTQTTLKRQPQFTPRSENLRSTSNPLSTIPTVTTMAPPLNEYEITAYKISAQAGTISPPVPITIKVKINPPLYDSWSIDLGVHFPKVQPGKSYLRFSFDPVETARSYIEISPDHSGCSCGRARLSELAEKRKANETQENQKPAFDQASTPAPVSTSATPAPTLATAPTPASDPTTAPPSATASTPAPTTRPRAASVVGAASLIGAAAFGVFGPASPKKFDKFSDCSGSCKTRRYVAAKPNMGRFWKSRAPTGKISVSYMVYVYPEEKDILYEQPPGMPVRHRAGSISLPGLMTQKPQDFSINDLQVPLLDREMPVRHALRGPPKPAEAWYRKQLVLVRIEDRLPVDVAGGEGIRGRKEEELKELQLYLHHKYRVDMKELKGRFEIPQEVKKGLLPVVSKTQAQAVVSKVMVEREVKDKGKSVDGGKGNKKGGNQKKKAN